MTKEEFMRLAAQVAALVDKKGQDYGNETAKLGTYFPFHHYSYVQMLWVKVLRLLSLTRKHEISPELKPNFESVEDTTNDLIAYAIFYKSFLEKRNNEQKPK